MKNFSMSPGALAKLFGSSERETLDYVLTGLAEAYGDRAPDADAVRYFLTGSGKAARLTPREQALVMDKLLECLEVDFRMFCDLTRYRYMKAAGMVRSMDEFLAMFHGGDGA